MRNKKKDAELASLTDKAWLADLTFLVDVSQHLNDLNLILQGDNQLVCHLVNHVSAFRTKLKLFQQQAGSGNFVHFPTFQSMLQKTRTLIHRVMLGSWRL